MTDLDQISLPTYNVPLTVFELGVLTSSLTSGGFKIPKRIEKVIKNIFEGGK